MSSSNVNSKACDIYLQVLPEFACDPLSIASGCRCGGTYETSVGTMSLVQVKIKVSNKSVKAPWMPGGKIEGNCCSYPLVKMEALNKM